MNNSIQETIKSGFYKINKIITPHTPVPKGYKKIIHKFYTEIVPENHIVAITPRPKYPNHISWS